MIELEQLKQFAGTAKSHPDMTHLLSLHLRDRLATLAEPALEIVYREGGPLADVLAEEILHSEDLHLIATLYNHLNNGLPGLTGMPRFPAGNVAFGKVAVAVGRRALDVALMQSDLSMMRRSGAALFTNLAGWHTVIGQGNEALKVAEEALRFFANDKDSDDTELRANYARSLDMLVSSLRQLGLYEQAQVAGLDAIRLFRTLSIAEPEKYETDLARSLVNWAGGASKHDASKLGAYEEAANLYRKHRTGGTVLFQKELCETLVGFISILLEAEQFDRANEIGQEAVSLASDLDARNRESFCPLLVMAQANLALVYQRCGKTVEALNHYGKAIAFADLLAFPDQFTRATAYIPLLAHCLTGCAIALVDAKRLEDAYEHLKRATELIPDSQDGNIGPQELAVRQFNFAILAYETNHDDEVLTAVEKARTLYLILDQSQPGQYQSAFTTLAELEGLTLKRQDNKPATGPE